MPSSFRTIFFFIIIYFLTFFFTPTSPLHHYHSTIVNRRILHQPLFPLDHSLPPALPPTTQPPLTSPASSQPQPQPKYPFSSLSPPNIPQILNNPFFPSYFSPPPAPPPPPSSALSTFPANISSLMLPRSSSSSSSRPISHKLIAVIVSVSLLSTFLIAAVAASLLLHHQSRSRYYHNHHFSKTDSLRLFPPNTTPSDSTTTKNPPSGPSPPALPRHTPSSTSSEFLYLGTLVSSRDVSHEASTIPRSPKSHNSTIPLASASASLHYHRLGSPELHPLPPLPRQQHFQPDYKNATMGSDDDEEFFSPRESTGDKYSPDRTGSAENLRSQSSNSFHHSNSQSQAHSLSSSPSIVLNLSPKSSIRSKSPDSLVNFPAPPLCIPPPRVRERRGLSSSPPSSGDTKNSPSRVSDYSGMTMESPGERLSFSGPFGGVKQTPPPPPPPPPARFWETPVVNAGPPVLVAPSRPVVGQNLGNGLGNLGTMEGRNENGVKPKLKPLHWDKVRASSDRAMVWDQLKSSSFQLNEEMIETLFTANSSNSNPRDGIRRPLMPVINLENQVLDQKKSQNIAILLRALNVTIEEVCEALLEGNADMLGTELLESLLKMAPTKVEEQKLMEFTDESPFKLGPAEKFLKAVLHIPHAFRRVDSMLYIANFDSEVEYLKRSFETLEEACKELRNSRMFLKLLEAVLKTGNRMNVGTNRGDAHAFKLDTLLKLVDVKGTDGRTTLLHFVVQEIIRAEGSRLAGADQNQTAEADQQYTLQNEVEFRKIGLQVVSGLSGELSNVKKAASMDSDSLNGDVLKLACGITKVTEILKLNDELALTDSCRKFSESMNAFLRKGEEDIINIQAQEGVALSMVRELTEYFHGNSVKEEAHPFRIFMIVKDFLCILDQVCKDVGKVNERTIVSSGRQFPTPVNPSLPQVFPGLNGRQHCSSDDDESSSLS
ncbi:hypothetical protein ACH5RR_032283 [Cinchona calisaya]|uniref:Formin-like protein n=1 Tax=Cinchona calisaya TaxID=153742 RepID=A0ABD2YHN6_9GENT